VQLRCCATSLGVEDVALNLSPNDDSDVNSNAPF
jgi:hypothetical protein